MGRTRIKYDKPRDPAEEARKQAVNQSQIQRQAQASAYAAARFNEWAAGAQDREALMNARLQNQQSEAELKGAQFRYDFWKDNELRRQTTAYYTAMPALQEQLKSNGIYPGSARYVAEISAFAAELPDAVTHNEAIRKELMDFSKVDATAAEIADKMKTFQQGYQDATGQTPTKIHVGANNQITGEAAIGIPEKIADRYSRLQGAIELHQDLAASQLKDDMAHNRQNMPYADQPKLSAARRDASILEKAYPNLTSLGSDQGTGQTTAIPTPTPAPTTLQATPIPQATSVQTPVPSGVPQVGEIRGGFTFKGGDPGDQNNWAQSQ